MVESVRQVAGARDKEVIWLGGKTVGLLSLSRFKRCGKRVQRHYLF